MNLETSMHYIEVNPSNDPRTMAARLRLTVALDGTVKAQPDSIARSRCGAWSVLFSMDDAISIFSAKLITRGSTEADWRLLGELTSAIGVPAGCMPSTIRSDPSAVHKFIWATKDTVDVPAAPAFGPTPEVVRPAAGRNSPCPCGSGRKFKKCCQQKQVGPCDYANCGDPGRGVFWCTLCNKVYSHCKTHQTEVRTMLAGHGLRVHPEAVPFLVDQVMADPATRATIEREAQAQPALWERFFAFWRTRT